MSGRPEDGGKASQSWDERLVSVSRALVISAAAAKVMSRAVFPLIPAWGVFGVILIFVIVEGKLDTSHL